jgi:hypothetical protein
MGEVLKKNQLLEHPSRSSKCDTIDSKRPNE